MTTDTSISMGRSSFDPSGGLVFPASWHAFLRDGAEVELQVIGESRADVFRIRQANSTDLFIKSEMAGALSELPAEVERLRWMRSVGLPCPVVLDALQHDGRHWLLMSAVAGCDLASATDLTPTQVTSILAQALRNLHALPWADCPFDHRPDQRVLAAKARVDAKAVDETDFDDERQGLTAEQVFAQLVAAQPHTLDPVVTHGDACLPNLLADGAVFSGFIDCGRLGVSDRYQDLALAARSVARNLGDEWVAAFFDAYGVSPDAERIRFYQLLDEFY